MHDAVAVSESDKRLVQAGLNVTRDDREISISLQDGGRDYLVGTITDAEYQEMLAEDALSPKPDLSDAIHLPIDGQGEQRFSVQGELGRGAGGTVFAVYDKLIDREVALKIVRHEDEGEKYVHRFVREARVTAQLEHPNILPIYEVNVDDQERTFFTMRKAPGTSLDHLLAQAEDGQIPESILAFENRVEIMLRACDAMHYAHAQGVIHQDIKPGNIMLGAFGEVLVVDWGAALMREDERMHGRMMGTPAYMSPEQARREGADERSDIYCLGATFYHLLCFRMPTTATTTDEFWERKCKGLLDGLPAEIEYQIPRLLLDVCRKAMAADVNDRYQNVTELRDALLEWRRHSESLAICDQADMAVLKMPSFTAYKEFEEVRSQYATALQICPDNLQAKDSLQEVEVGYARCALQHGDVDLAISLLPDEYPKDIQEALAKVMRERERVAQRGRRLRSTILVFGLTVCAFIFWLVNDYLNQFGEWQLVYEVDFTDQDASIAGIDWAKTRYLSSIAPPRRSEHGMHIERLGMLWLKDHNVRGNARITAKIEFREDIDAIEMFLQCKREEPPLYWYVPSGFSCQFAGHANLLSYISKNYKTGAVDHTASIATHFETGKTYELSFERNDDRLALYVDGDLLFEEYVILPVTGPDHSKVGLRSWANCYIKSFKVERLSLPLKSSPLVAADAVLAAGNKEAAFRTYVSLIEDYADSSVAERATARACLLAFHMGQTLDALQLLENLRHKFPQSRFIDACLAEEALYRWEDGDVDRSIELAAEVLHINPHNRIVIHLLNKPRRRLAIDQRDALLKLLGYYDVIVKLDLPGLDLIDLEFLRGVDVISLNVAGNMITDLGPLRDARLKVATFSENGIKDLSPLADSACHRLALNDNLISDLRPLAKLPLKELDIRGNQLTDLSGLEQTPIARLDVRDNPIVDLAPLAQCQQLRDLNIVKTQVADLSPLQGMPLQGLAADRTQISDLAPVASEALKRLSIQRCPVVDLTPLRVAPLESLNIGRTRIRDLGAVAAAPLQSLNVQSTGIADLSPLKTTELKELNISRTPLQSLPAHLARSLKSLDATEVQLTSWNDLAGLHALEWLIIKHESLADFDPTVVLSAWQQHEVPASMQRRLKAAIAFERKDWKQLKALSYPYKQSHYLPLPFHASFDDAHAIAESVGGRLLEFHGDDGLQKFMKSGVFFLICCEYILLG